jgi:hypothetical protein
MHMDVRLEFSWAFDLSTTCEFSSIIFSRLSGFVHGKCGFWHLTLVFPIASIQKVRRYVQYILCGRFWTHDYLASLQIHAIIYKRIPEVDSNAVRRVSKILESCFKTTWYIYIYIILKCCHCSSGNISGITARPSLDWRSRKSFRRGNIKQSWIMNGN